MTRLIVTTDSSIAGAIQQAGLADLVIAIERRLVWEPLSSNAELEAFFAPRRSQPHGLHWLDDTPARRLEESGAKDSGLIELLILLWLLDHWRRTRNANPDFVARCLSLGVRDIEPPRGELYPPNVEIESHELKLASRAWRAFCAPTPESWRDLFKTNLAWLPQLSPYATALLEELPRPASGVGATELRILRLIARGGVQPLDVFPGRQKHEELHVYGYWEVGELLDGLSRCDRPAVAGLDEGSFSMEMHNDPVRFDRYKRSQLSLTEFGKAVLQGDQNFRRHNRIDRWWGGTHLTNDRLWWWDGETRALVAPG